MQSDMLKGSLLIFLQAACFAMLPIFTRWIYRDDTIAPLDVVTWRFIVAVGAAWLLLLVMREYRVLTKLTRQQIGTLLMLGGIFSIAGICAAVGLERVAATTYILLYYTYPAMVAVMSAFLGEPLPLSKWAAVGLALAGCALTISGRIEVRSAFDLTIPLVNALAAAVYLIVARRYNRVAGLPAGAVSMGGTLGILLILVLVRGLHAPATSEGWLSLLGLGSISTVLPIMFTFAALAYISAANAAVLSTVEPILVLILAAVLLSERITGLQVVGGSLVITSVILLHMPVRKRKAQKIAAPLY